MLLTLLALFLDPEPSRALLARTWQVEAERLLAYTWAERSHGQNLAAVSLLCGGRAQLAANLEAGSVACYLYPAGARAGAVQIPYICCPVFFPCSEEIGADRRLLETGTCVIPSFPDML